MKLKNTTELEWVTVDEDLLLSGYSFFLNVRAIRDFFKKMSLEDTTLKIQIWRWRGLSDRPTAAVGANSRNRSYLITVKLSERLLTLTEEEKIDMRSHECPFPETLELIANDLIRHEICHIEWWKRSGDPFGQRSFWRDDEKKVQETTAQFIEDVRRGRAEPLIVLEGGQQSFDLQIPLPFANLHKLL